MLRSVVTSPNPDTRQVSLVKVYKWFEDKKLAVNQAPVDIELINRLKRQKVERRMAAKSTLKDEAFLPPLIKTEQHRLNQQKALQKSNRL